MTIKYGSMRYVSCNISQCNDNMASFEIAFLCFVPIQIAVMDNCIFHSGWSCSEQQSKSLCGNFQWTLPNARYATLYVMFGEDSSVYSVCKTKIQFGVPFAYSHIKTHPIIMCV